MGSFYLNNGGVVCLVLYVIRQHTAAVILLLGSPQRLDAGARLHWTGKQLVVLTLAAATCILGLS